MPQKGDSQILTQFSPLTILSLKEWKWELVKEIPRRLGVSPRSSDGQDQGSPTGPVFTLQIEVMD